MPKQKVIPTALLTVLVVGPAKSGKTALIDWLLSAIEEGKKSGTLPPALEGTIVTFLERATIKT